MWKIARRVVPLSWPSRSDTVCTIFSTAALIVLLTVALRSATGTSGHGAGTNDLENPPERRSVGTEFTTSLTVAYSDHKIGTQNVHLRNYEGMLTGPTLRLRPGDTLNVALCNKLPSEPGELRHSAPPHDTPRHIPPHGFNTTNLHTHGLHVSPVGNSDNVFLEIGPGQEFPYEIKVPRDHHPGTFWYHAHKHGSVALQLSSGMAGALIVEGGLDNVPAIRCVRERIMVFQQIAFDRNGKVEGDYYPLKSQAINPRPTGRNEATTINGQLVPNVHMRPCEVQRWRMIHAGVQAELNLMLECHKLNEIACDGIALGRVVPRDYVLLYPGYRSDVLVRAASKPGRYPLKKTRVPKEIALWPDAQQKDEVLAIVIVQGDPLPMKLPKNEDVKNLAPFKPINAVDGMVEIKFDLKNGWGTVNGVEFDPTVDPLPLKIGKAQEWHIAALHEVHPFHIHVNPFEVITRDSHNAIIDRVWKDTMVVTKQKDVYFRTRYVKYIGRSVLHCHNLLHEDKGMMRAFEIQQ